MRGPFVAKDGGAGGFGLPVGFAADQQVDPLGEGAQLHILLGDHVRQLLDGFVQVSDLFFHLLRAV